MMATRERSMSFVGSRIESRGATFINKPSSLVNPYVDSSFNSPGRRRKVSFRGP